MNNTKLYLEYLRNELSRDIQNYRKSLGCPLDARIHLEVTHDEPWFKTLAEDKGLVKSLKDHCLCESLVFCYDYMRDYDNKIKLHFHGRHSWHCGISYQLTKNL